MFSLSLSSVSANSMQDFCHVHTFKGHEHTIKALLCVDEEKPLCISADSGGGIYVWGTCSPLGQEPLKILYEQKDWRFSGIHALAFRSGYIYTGSGDRTVKAWSLQVRVLHLFILLYCLLLFTYMYLFRSQWKTSLLSLNFRMAPYHAQCLVINQLFQHSQFVIVFFIAAVGMELSDYGVSAITVLWQY